jgi:hypothetical protein
MGKRKKDLEAVRKSVDAEYSYLYKTADRLDFLWEFLRRNETYIKAYREFSHDKDYWFQPVYDPRRTRMKTTLNGMRGQTAAGFTIGTGNCSTPRP